MLLLFDSTFITIYGTVQMQSSDAVVIFFVFEVRQHDIVLCCRSHFVNLFL